MIKNVCAFAIMAMIGLVTEAQPQSKPLPPEYQQVLPRGAIPAITEPQYVKAEDAKIGKNTWVLGVVIEGKALAYSLNLLNHHEVVNDKIGKTAFAAVW